MHFQSTLLLSSLKNKYISYLIGGLLNFVAHNVDYINQKAVISKPVVDMSSSYPACQKSPISGQETLCRRANQGLYNETVTSLHVVADAVKINVDKVIYGFDDNGQPYSTFWTLVDGITLLKKINPVLIGMIPCLENEYQSKLFLSEPWNGFSVGTYFVRIPQKDIQTQYAVYIPYFADNTFSIAYIEKEKALCIEQRSDQQKRGLFVALLHRLIVYAASEDASSVVPYVWGGCSFSTPNDKNDFFYAQGCWHRPSQGETYQGYDCSGLIWRMAQGAGIPFVWKVSKLIGQYCRPVDENNMLEEGDIIWFEGHTMVVASIHGNTLIEAAGYSTGYGCVHCIPLSKRFAGINTYQDLYNAYLNKQPIGLLDAQGNEFKQVSVKLLKLMPPYQ
ncbi:hypothetical protein EKK58_03305 [Candidatus Dependentiae bacterium]|nr:MAG: hypothetical protein EKK58_03305 [Candidatus Dependentiae bacterium]